MTLTITEFEQFMDDYEAVNQYKLHAEQVGITAVELMAVSYDDVKMGFFTKHESELYTEQAYITAKEAAHHANIYIILMEEL